MVFLQGGFLLERGFKMSEVFLFDNSTDLFNLGLKTAFLFPKIKFLGTEKNQ
jgi:hypothetical protein